MSFQVSLLRRPLGVRKNELLQQSCRSATLLDLQGESGPLQQSCCRLPLDGRYWRHAQGRISVDGPLRACRAVDTLAAAEAEPAGTIAHGRAHARQHALA